MAKKIPQKKDAIFVVTSKTTIEVSEQNHTLNNLLRSAKKIYCFGKKTADLLAKANKNTIYFRECNSSEDLAQKIRKIDSKEIHWIGSKQKTFNIKDFIATHNLKWNIIDIYQTLPCFINSKGSPIKTEELSVVFNKENINIICFSSPSAVRGFFSVAGLQETINSSPQNLIVTIGKTTAKEAYNFSKKVTVCSSQTIESLIDCAENILR